MIAPRAFAGGMAVSLAVHAGALALVAAGMIGLGGAERFNDAESDGPVVIAIDIVDEVPAPPQPEIAAAPEIDAEDIQEDPPERQEIAVPREVTGAIEQRIERIAARESVAEPAVEEVPTQIERAETIIETVKTEAAKKSTVPLPTVIAALAPAEETVPPPPAKVEAIEAKPPAPPVKPAKSAARPKKTVKTPKTAEKPAKKSKPKPAQLAQAATGAAAAGRAAGTSKKALAAYAGKLRRWVEKHKRYPAAARRAGARGDVTLKVKIARNGSVVGASIVKASGKPLLDQDAAGLPRRAAPFPPMPGEVSGKTFSFTVTIRYTGR